MKNILLVILAVLACVCPAQNTQPVKGTSLNITGNSTIGGTLNVTGNISGPLNPAGTNAAVSMIAANSHVVFEGDSTTCGYPPVTTPGVNDWPTVLMTLSNFAGKGVTKHTFAVSGNTVADMAARYTASVRPWRPAVTGVQGTLFVLCGSNDIAFGAGGNTTNTGLSNYCTTAMADGFTVVMGTVLDRNDYTGPKRQQLNILNQRIRKATYYHHLIDHNRLLTNPLDFDIFGDGVHQSPAACAMEADHINERLTIGTAQVESTGDLNAAYLRLSDWFRHWGKSTYYDSGAAGDPLMLFYGAPATGTASTARAMILLEPLTIGTSNNWSTGGTFLGVNANSAFSGNLLDVQKEAVSAFKVSNAGTVAVGGVFDNNAALALTSTTRGFLPPRLTAAQVGTLAALTPTAGTQVYQTDGTAGNYTYSGGAFVRGLTSLDPTGDVRNYPLSGFTRRYANTALPGMLGISGVTYNPRSGTLFLVRNISAAAGFTYEYSLDGNLLRTITHSNFIDTEGICWAGWDAATASDVFIYTQEDHSVDAALDSSLVIIRMTPAATTLDGATGVTATTGYGGDSMANLGVESVAYDPRRGVVYYTAEKRTAAGDQNTPGSVDAKIYTRTVTTTGTFTWGAESVLCDIAPLFSGTLTDISDMCYDNNTDTLLLLSHESFKAVRLNRTTGALLDSLAIPGNQPEGLAVHPSGTELYVTGEEDEYYRYTLGWHAPADTSGTWTAVSSAPTNVATLTINKGQYMRVGSVVTYSTRFVLAQTASGATAFKLSLPVVSNFAAEEDAAGIVNGVGTSSVYGNVTADAATDTLWVRLAASVTTSQTWCLQVTYQVLP